LNLLIFFQITSIELELFVNGQFKVPVVLKAQTNFYFFIYFNISNDCYVGPEYLQVRQFGICYDFEKLKLGSKCELYSSLFFPEVNVK
jgi:hypothetical protein